MSQEIRMIRSAARYELPKLAEIYSASWHLAFSKHFPPENLARVTLGDFEQRWRGYFADDAVSSFVYEQDSVPLGFVTCKLQKDVPAQLKAYQTVVPPIIARYRGKFIVRGGDTVTREGPAESRRIVVIEFPELSDVRAFYHSPEYTEAHKLREGIARF